MYLGNRLLLHNARWKHMFVAARFSRNFRGKSLKEQSGCRFVRCFVWGPFCSLCQQANRFLHTHEHTCAHNTEVFVDGLFSQSRPRLLNVNTHAQKFWLSKLQTASYTGCSSIVFLFVDAVTPIPCCSWLYHRVNGLFVLPGFTDKFQQQGEKRSCSFRA